MCASPSGRWRRPRSARPPPRRPSMAGPRPARSPTRPPRHWRARSRPSTTCARPPTTDEPSPAASSIGSSGTPEAGELKIPTRADVQVFPSAADFRAWLEANHDTEQELFIGYYRKGVPKTAMTYPESVEEALCYGWIDGITRRIDAEVTCTRFTPRRKTSNWSAINIARIGELTAAGRMHPAGLHAFETRDRRNDGVYSYE